MTAPQDAETYIQIEVIILVLINFACKLRIRFATLFENHLFLLGHSFHNIFTQRDLANQENTVYFCISFPAECN